MIIDAILQSYESNIHYWKIDTANNPVDAT